MSDLIIFFIEMYQKYLSPHKGFQCAHVYLYHEASCSEEVICIIRENGITHSLSKISNRFKACRDAYLLLSSKEVNQKKRSRRDVDCCNSDPGSVCDIRDCMSDKVNCGFPELPCDCSIF